MSDESFHSDLYAETLGALRGQTPVSVVRPKTLADLSWDGVVAELNEHVRTPEARELIAELCPLSSQELAERRHAEVAEWMELLSEGEDAPIYGVSDIRKAVAHAERDGVLVAEDLDAIRRNGDVVARGKRFFANRGQHVPKLAAIGSLLDPCEDLREALGAAIEPGGRLSDNASPDLRRLRRAVQNHTDRLKSAVDRMLSSRDLEHQLQDDYYTVREDRYVLPIRVGAKSSVPGIVHGYSSSGRTAFVEPQELVEMNNQLRWAQIEVQEEERRILARLTAFVARHADALLRNTEVLAYLDLTGGIARFGRATQSAIPTFAPALQLRDCRHPLLFLKLEASKGKSDNPTVANDIVLDTERSVLVVSGPNTGGKTVLLKSLGLAALMASCGMPIAADGRSVMPFYRHIFTDIGDEQSIERDLSTFSGHLVNIAGFLDDCGEGTLVLLDELFTGTDPLQGAALAVALLEDLAERGATVTVTTHLEGLKTLALQSDRFANAAMGFDIETLAPTYRVTLGVPGSSFALRIADRLGFPQELVQRAHAILEGDDRVSLDEALVKLDEQVRQLAAERNRLDHERRAAEKAKKKFQDKRARLVERDREAVMEETRVLRSKLAEVRKLAKETHRVLREAETMSRGEIEAMRDRLRGAGEVVDNVRDQVEPAPQAPAGLARVDRKDLEPGTPIYVLPFKRNGEVLQVQDDDVVVQVGPLKATVALDDVFHPTEKSRRERRSAKAKVERIKPSQTAVQTDENTVDLRGLRADEAIDRLDVFLDYSYLKGIPGVFIIHGHGTGALKRAVRGHLPSSSYVDEFRPGERGEGGDGVTVAFLSG